MAPAAPQAHDETNATDAEAPTHDRNGVDSARPALETPIPARSSFGRDDADTQLGKDKPGGPRRPSLLPSGELIDGRYRLVKQLGEGSVGVVYLANHELVNRRVALKVLRSELARDPDVVGRFIAEAKASSQIQSRHIIDTLDFGILNNGAAYIAMECLEGETLADRLEGEPFPLPIEEAVHLSAQIAEGLGAAHEAGIIHRDLKPENVFIVPQEDAKPLVKILDFGIAKVIGAESKLTRAGTVFGTPHYMSPEQSSGRPVDHRTDIYALGVMMYEMVSGKVPFEGENALAVLAQHVSGTPAPLRGEQSAQEVPEVLEAAIFRCLAKNPDERFATMKELAKALRGLDTAEPGGTFRAIVSEEAPAETPRKRSVVGLVAAGVALAAAVGGFYVLDSRSQTPALPEPIESTVASAVPPPVVSSEEASAEDAANAADAAGKSDAGVPEEAATTVHLVLFPLDSEVYHGEKNLGPMPVSVDVPEGETRLLTVRRRGYWARRLELDGSRSRVVVGLVPRKDDEPEPAPESTADADARAAAAAEQMDAGAASTTENEKPSDKPTAEPKAESPKAEGGGESDPSTSEGETKPAPSPKPKPPPTEAEGKPAEDSQPQEPEENAEP